MRALANCVLIVTIVILIVGCEGAGPLFDPSTTDIGSRTVTATEYRDQFQETRSRRAIRWLLAHEIENGMTIKDVGRALGQEGQIEPNDNWLKTQGGTYRTTDQAWKWGPDDKGRTYYLIFRDGRLVNFDPSEFAESSI